MAIPTVGLIGQDTPNWSEANCGRDVSDQQLLERFVAHRDEAAFAGLLQRHARTVWGVCRRVLPREQDAEDAYQAVFLALARSAASIRKGTALGSWLYSVAFRTALRARKNEGRRSAAEKAATIPCAGSSPSSEAACRELQQKLDEELLRLPEKYRAPFVLCCLDGMSKSEAARELGWKEGTVSGRLARARKRLQTRLAQRGFKLSAILTALALTRELAWAQPPVALVQATAGAVLSADADALSPSVRSLADGTLRELTPTRLTPILLALAALIFLLLGAGLTTHVLTSKATAPAVVVEPDTFLPPPIALGTPVDEQVLAVAFSPDGKRLVTAGGRGAIPGQIKIWDTDSGKELNRARQKHGARAAAFAPDGQTFVTGDFRGAIILHDAVTGEERASAPAHPGGVSGLAFSKDGAWLASAGLDHTTKIWRVDGLQEKNSLGGHDDYVLAVAFFNARHAIVTVSQDRSAKIWDLNAGKEKVKLIGHQGAIEAVAVSPDDSLIATASWDGTVRLWNADTGAENAVLGGEPGQAFYAVAFSPDGALLAGGGRDGTISVWNPKTRESLGILEGHKAPVWSLSFSQPGVLASGSADRTAKLWHFGSGKRPRELVTSWSATRPILATVYAPDGSVLAVATTDNNVFIRDAKTGDVVKTLHGHTAQINCLGFSADGKMLASGSDDQTVKLWDWAAGEELHTLTGHEAAIHAVTFIADGKQLASAGDDKTIRVWEIGSAKQAFVLEGHDGPIRALAVATDGRMLASGGADRSIKIWDLEQRTARRTLQGHDDAVRALAFSPTGLLASASDDKTVKLWDPSENAARRTLTGHTGGVWALAISPLGTTLVSASQDATIRVWDPLTGQSRGILRKHKDAITALALHPHGLNLVSGSHDTVLYRWQAGKFQPVPAQAEPADQPKPNFVIAQPKAPDKVAPAKGDQPANPEKVVPAKEPQAEPERFVPPASPFIPQIDEQVLAVAFSPDGKRIATSSGGFGQAGQFKIWHVQTAEELSYVRDISTARSVAWSPDGKSLATGDFGGAIRLRDPESGLSSISAKGHKIGVNGVAYSFDGKMLVSAGLDNVVKLWNTANLQEQKQFIGHTGMALSAAFFRHGQAFVTTSKDGTARIWDIATGKEKQILRGHQGWVETAAITPDDKTVATAGWDKTIRLWDADTGADKGTLEGHSAPVLAIAISPDGKWLASAGYDMTILIWDLATQKQFASLGKHKGSVWTLAFSRDGVLASGGSDAVVKLWSIADKKEIAVLPTSDRRPIRAIAYSRKGRVALAKEDKTVRMHDALTGALLHVLRGHGDLVTCLAFSPNGDLLATGGADKTVQLWNLETGECVQALPARASVATALEFTPDGKTITVGREDGSVQSYNAVTGAESETLKPDAGAIRALAYAPDGRLAVGGDDPAIKIFDPAKKGVFGILRGHGGPVRALAFSTDGMLASAGDDGTVKIWEQNQPRERYTLKGHEGAVLALAFSPRGQRLISGGADSTIRMWDPETGQAAGVLRRHVGPVTTLAMNPAGTGFLSGGKDGLVLRWPRAAGAFPTLPVILRHDFRGAKFENEFLKIAYNHPPDRFFPEPEGLRITPPTTVPRGQPTALRTTFPLRGDFDVIFSYELLKADFPTDGAAIGVSLYLETATPTQDGIAVGRFNKQDGPFYRATGVMTTPIGQKRVFPAAKHLATEVMAGQLRLVRQGGTVRFLAADEGAEGFVELRRVKLGMDDVAFVRLVVDPGNKDSPPVVARFRSIEVRGQVSAVKAPPPPPPIEKNYARTYFQPLTVEPPMPPFMIRGQEWRDRVRFEPAGLRITLPTGFEKQLPGTGLHLLTPVQGDFEITVGFEILKEPEPADAGPFGTRLSLGLHLETPERNEASISRRMDIKQASRFASYVIMANAATGNGTHYFRTDAKVGRLRLVRSGATLYWYAANGKEGEFVQYDQRPFSDAEVKSLYVNASTGGNDAFLDVRFTDLRIRADGLPNLPAQVAALPVGGPETKKEQAAPPPADAVPPRNYGWLIFALAVGIVLMLCFAATFGLWFVQQRRQTAAPLAHDVPSTPAFLAFACPNCGKKIKAKPALAGKKVKCSRCGKVSPAPPADDDEANLPVV